jgi:hypothetical protein
VLFPPESPRLDQQEQQYCALLRVGLVGTGYLLGHSLDALVRGLVHIIMVSSIYYGDIDLAINHKNGFYTMTLPGDSPADSGVLPLPETLESGSIRAALPRTGELSPGEANDEIARNAGAGVVPAAEIPFQLSANLISMDDDAYAKWRTT